MIDDDDDEYDNNRTEMSWSDKVEERLVLIASESKELGMLHNVSSTYNKYFYYSSSTISIIIPFIITFINAVNELSPSRNNYEMLNIILVMVSGVVNALNTFMSFGKRQSEHTIASIRYYELVTEIDNVLTIKRKYRTAADVTLRQFTTQLESLQKFSIGL